MKKIFIIMAMMFNTAMFAQIGIYNPNVPNAITTAQYLGINNQGMQIKSSFGLVIPWTTRSADNQRSGFNSNETTLTQAGISTHGLIQKTVVPVCCDARGVEAQPLVAPGVFTDKGTQDIMILASMSNQVRAVNYQTGADIWDVSLGFQPITGSGAIDFHYINEYWGALSTGVVDLVDNRFYQVFWGSPDGSGSPNTARYYMAVLNLRDGSQVVPPVLITGVSQGYDFNQAMRKARSSAVLINQNGTRTVLQCTGTVQETSKGSEGFCFAFDTFTNKVTAMLATTAGEGAGIWMAGQGLSCSSIGRGYCYAVTGNGDFDGVTQFGESFIQLQYVPPTATTQAFLSIVKGWSPWSDFQRSGQAQVPAGKIAGESLASEASRPVGGNMTMAMTDAHLIATVNAAGVPQVLAFPNMATGNWSDEDWGSAGPACIFQIGVCVAAGKDGIAYPISVPNFIATTALNVGTQENYYNLAAPPQWATMDPGNVSATPIDPKDLNFFPNLSTAHLHATPVQFYNPVTSTYEIALGGENQQVHVWAVSKTGVMTYQGEGNEYASSDLRNRPPGGMTSSMCAGSSNGNNPDTYILACIMPYLDANAVVGPGHLVIYDPIHIVNGVMPTLWDSANWGAHVPGSQWSCMMDKFLPPVIDGGEIIMPCYDGRVMILTQGGQ